MPGVKGLPRCFLFQIFFLAGVFLTSINSYAANVVDLRLWRAPDNTRIVFDLDGSIEHKVFTLRNPDRVVIDIPNATFKANVNELDLNQSPIRHIRTATQNGNDLRVVLDLKKEVGTRSFFLKKTAQAHDRLVLDLNDKGKTKTSVTKTVQDIKKQNRDLIIAIDAGHGGEDPGALGKNKVYEKHVVMAIAKELARLFSKEKGYKAVLIRSGDYYITLSERRNLARKSRADMFVSIHADAFTNPQAHGSSVYALSSKGATSASAKFLANKENQSDLVGGVSLDDKDHILSSVLIDLSMTHKMAASLEVGGHVLGRMDKISRLHSKHVEQAAFAVLKTPDIPSILVETGFISNPGEAKKLASKPYQKKMASALFNGIHSYFKEKAPEDTYIANQYSKQGKERVYIVERGDTLSDIAGRYAISMKKLSSHNRLTSNSLRIGQKLKIPTL